MPELITLRAGELPSRETLARAAEAVSRGEVVAFPTDTVYGLGTSASSREGVARIYRMKGRGQDRPLPLLGASAEALRRWVEWTPQAEALAARFWPGGLTLVLKASPEGRSLACCRGETLAVRVPDHPVALALLEGSPLPWAQTSANGSGEPPLPDGAAVARRFGGELALAIDSGPAGGKESSVVEAAGPVRVLREGAIPSREILAVLAPPRRVLFVCTGNSCRSVMAEALLNRAARERGLDLEARSAGVAAADPSFPTPAGVRRALAAAGIPSVQHIPQPVTRELLDWADHILVMERRQRELLLGLYPDAAPKVATLGGAEDIADPIGQADEAYVECCRKLARSLDAILSRHRKESTHASHS
ncbi:MAG: L-threonylcarbamoyladenylate synthase [Elusimicrobia bacterium]|nr:L-threonylcarbamoyladenylate synthase [Elusimicrobiota bacterium]